MISIIVNNENLDLYEENEINFEWTSFAFSKTVKEPYSTDFTIPKSSTNIRLLGIVNLQDEIVFDFQEDYIKGVLIVEEKPININIQVINVNKDEISIFIVESNPVEELLSKNLVKKFDGDEDGILIDSNSTIFPWNNNTQTQYPYDFLKYYYGSPYDYRFAQLHPSKRLDSVVYNATWHGFHVTTEHLLDNTDYYHDMYLVATNKYVCPQNQVQCLKGYLKSSNNGYFSFYGGQHITNDCEGDVNDNYTIITFNRNCSIRLNLVYTFFSRNNFDTNPQLIIETTNNTVLQSFTVPARTYTNHTIRQNTVTFNVSKDDEVRVRVTQASKFDEKFKVLLLMEIYNYETFKEDIGVDLKYRYPNAIPRIGSYTYGGKEIDDYQTVLVSGKEYIKEYYSYSDKGDAWKNDTSIQYPKYYYVYFGYYCNLPEIKMKDLIYNLSWMSNRKLNFDKDNVINFAPFNVYTLEKDYEITNTEFLDDHFGKKTSFKCKNEELEDVKLSDTFNINNKWLSNNVAIKESIFAKLYGGANNILIIPQYSEFENDNDEFKSNYDEVEGVALGVLNTTNPNNKYLQPIDYFIPSDVGTTYPHIPRLLLDSVKQIYKVDITCYNTLDLSKYDFLNIDGRLYYIISGTKNIEDGSTNIKALLINDTDAFLFNENGELTTWQ